MLILAELIGHLAHVKRAVVQLTVQDMQLKDGLPITVLEVLLKGHKSTRPSICAVTRVRRSSTAGGEGGLAAIDRHPLHVAREGLLLP